MSLTTPEKIETLQRKLYAKAKAKSGFATMSVRADHDTYEGVPGRCSNTNGSSAAGISSG
jgi:hypothetical protein